MVKQDTVYRKPMDCMDSDIERSIFIDNIFLSIMGKYVHRERLLAAIQSDPWNSVNYDPSERETAELISDAVERALKNIQFKTNGDWGSRRSAKCKS